MTKCPKTSSLTLLSANSTGVPLPRKAYSVFELPQPILCFPGTSFRPTQTGGKGWAGKVWHRTLLPINKTFKLWAFGRVAWLSKPTQLSAASDWPVCWAFISGLAGGGSDRRPGPCLSGTSYYWSLGGVVSQSPHFP